jgi:hypothetical protein
MRALAVAILGLISAMAVAQTTKPAQIPTDAKTRKLHPATQPGQVLEMSIPELANFDFDAEAKDPQIADDVKKMNGVQIKLHGFMVPMDQADNFTKFALVPTLDRPDWQTPKIQETIIVTCPAGKCVSYYGNEIIVQGKLTVGIVKDEGYIISVFALDAVSVKPIDKNPHK